MEPTRDPDELRPEYDFAKMAGGVRGKYAQRRKAGGGYEQTSGNAANRESLFDSAFLRDAHTRLLPTLNDCVVSLVCEVDGQASQCGTGTLFRVADSSFLVTATHVVSEAEAKGLELYISDSTNGSSGVALRGSGYGHKDLDVMVWELTGSVVSALPGRRFLTVHQADRANRRPASGVYMLHGFPSCWAEQPEGTSRFNMHSFTSYTGLYPGYVGDLRDYDPEQHLLLSTPTAGGTPVTGNSLRPERLNGMSGCSVWQIAYTGLSPHHWTPDDAVIVGIQTGTYRDGTVTKATRWRVVDRILRHYYPQLAGPLSLVTA